MSQNGYRRRILEELPKNIGLNFVDLFETEIVDRFVLEPEKWHIFDDLIGETQVNSWIQKWGSDREGAASGLYKVLMGCPNNGKFYLKLLDFFEEVDVELYAIFSVDDWEKESFSLFAKFLNIMDRLIPHFDLPKVVDYLGKYSFVLKREYGRVLERWNNGEISEKYAKALIIRTICIMYDSSTFHLMYAILRCSEAARIAVENLFPDFEMFYVRSIFEDRDGVFHVVDQYDNLPDAIDKVMDPEIESPFAINVLFDYIPKYHIAPLFNRVTKDPPLNLRNYQYELAEPALNGKNAVICAPTGSGKTIVAAYIIRDHITKLRKDGKKPKIAFVVPTGPLVDQQKSVMEKYLKNMADTVGFRGNGAEELSWSTFEGSDIFVMTAKILVNASNPEYHYDDKPIPLERFTMIVLDEAHHTDKNHPFNELMDRYREEKYGNEYFPIRRMPQVVAMTASLGTSKDDKMESVKAHMKRMCANMEAEMISMPLKNLEELQQYTSNTRDEIMLIEPNNESTKQFEFELMNLKHYLEMAIKRIDGIAGVYESCLFADHPDIDLDSYIAWVTVALEKKLATEVILPQTSMKEARYCFTILRDIYWSLQCISCFPTEYATELYLKNLGKENGNYLEKQVFATVSRIIQLPKQKCPIFDKLIEIIEKQFQENPESKIMIFLKMKSYCLVAIKAIEESTGRKCSYITGANSASNDGGQTISEQQASLERFRKGETSILCGTTVLDEGLDIPNCNLVIKYSMATDEIAHVQRKGRARQLQSRCFLLTGNINVKKQEEKNQMLVKLMERAHHELSQQEISTLIQEEIRKINKSRIEKKLEESAKIARLESNRGNYLILCKDCNSVVTFSENIKRFHEQFVIADPTIWKRTDAVVIALNKRKNKNIAAHLICKGTTNHGICGHGLGKCSSWKGMALPLLSADKVIFATKLNPLFPNNRKVTKLWKTVKENLFYPENITPTELQMMKQAEGRPESLDAIEKDVDELMDVE